MIKDSSPSRWQGDYEPYTTSKPNLPFYDASAQGKTWGCSRMPVRWYLAPARPVELPVKFTRFTIYRLTADDFRALESAFKRTGRFG